LKLKYTISKVSKYILCTGL